MRPHCARRPSIRASAARRRRRGLRAPGQRAGNVASQEPVSSSSTGAADDETVLLRRLPCAVRPAVGGRDPDDLRRATCRRGPARIGERHTEGVGQEAPQSGAFALPSTGGARNRIFSASPCRPATAVCFAPGCTCSDSTTAAARCLLPPPWRRSRQRKSWVECRLEPRHRRISASCAATMTTSGDRSSVPQARQHTPDRPQERKRQRVECAGQRTGPVPPTTGIAWPRDHDDKQPEHRLEYREGWCGRPARNGRPRGPSSAKRAAERDIQRERATETGIRAVQRGTAQSMPFQPESTRRSGLTIQSVSAMTACPSGLRNGARSHCITKRSAAHT